MLSRCVLFGCHGFMNATSAEGASVNVRTKADLDGALHLVGAPECFGLVVEFTACPAGHLGILFCTLHPPSSQYKKC